MDEFIWEEEVDVVDAAAADDVETKEYYTKEEVDELLRLQYNKLAEAYNEVINTVNKRGQYLYDRMNNIIAENKSIKATLEEMTEEVNKYLLPKKEERKQQALERLNSGMYDFDDEEEEDDEN